MNIFTRLFHRPPVLPIDAPTLPSPVVHFYLSVNHDLLADQVRLRISKKYKAMNYVDRAAKCMEIVEWYRVDECRGRMPSRWFAEVETR